MMRRVDELDLKIDSILEGSKQVSTRNHHSHGSNREQSEEDTEDE